MYISTQQILMGDSFNGRRNKKLYRYSLKNRSKKKKKKNANKVGVTYRAAEQMHGQRRISFHRV